MLYAFQYGNGIVWIASIQFIDKEYYRLFCSIIRYKMFHFNFKFFYRCFLLFKFLQIFFSNLFCSI